jgi:hypothetical protein
MDLILFKIISLSASIVAKYLCKIFQKEQVQTAKHRMVWNIPLTIFSPSHKTAEFMASYDDCYKQGKTGFSSTNTVKYKISAIKLYQYHDSTQY